MFERDMTNARRVTKYDEAITEFNKAIEVNSSSAGPTITELSHIFLRMNGTSFGGG